MKKALVIGGGFFGLYISWYLARRGHSITLLEREQEVMQHASYNNQARVHNGYHYPRSVLTALRSRKSFPRFIEDFEQAVYKEFDKYYFIGKFLGKVTSNQFERFCRRIGADIDKAPYNVQKLANKQYIEDCFTTKEFAFDAVKLKEIIMSRISNEKIDILLNTEVISITQSIDKKLIIHTRNTGEQEITSEFYADNVFNCTYSRINFVTKNSGLPMIPLKHEMTEMCIVRVPDEIKKMGITVMCGPFFSVMPFPSISLGSECAHSFSHVRYTPHYEWHDKEDANYKDAYEKLTNDAKNSAWYLMKKDAARYMPCLSECKYERSLWEVKTVLPRSETDDSRPILCNFDYGLQGLHCIMGGKIDNVYDAVEAIQNRLGI